MKRSAIAELLTFSAAMTTQAATSASTFAVTVIIARQLGKEVLGIWAACWMVAYIVTEFHHALIQSPLRLLSFKDGHLDVPFIRSLVSLQYILILAVNTISIGVSLIVAMYIPFDKSYIVILPFLAAGHMVCEFNRVALFVSKRASVAIPIEVFKGALIVLAVWICCRTGSPDSLQNALILSAIVVVVSAIIGSVVFGAAPAGNPQRILAAARRSWQLSRWLVPLAVTQRAGQDLVFSITAIMAGPAALGGLRAMQQLVSPSNIIVQAVSLIVPARLSQCVSTGDHPLLVRTFGRYTAALSLCVLPVFLAIVFFRSEIVGFVYGNAFDEYSDVFVVLALGMVAIAIGTPTLSALLALGRSRTVLAVNICSGVLSLILITPMVQLYGVMGAAVTLGGYHIFQSAIAALSLSRAFGEATRRVG